VDPRYAPGVVHGRLDGDTIRLSVEGLDWQMGEIVTAFKQLTALPQKTHDDSGELTLPCTWAMVSQLANALPARGHVWQPDEALSQWIFNEVLRRGTTEGELKASFEGDRVPMPHQEAGAFVGAMNRRFFFADDMGTGKSCTALLALAEMRERGMEPFPAFVVCPASVVDPWLEEIKECFPSWSYTAYRTQPYIKGVQLAIPDRRKLSTRYNIYVMSYDVFRADMTIPHLAWCECDPPKSVRWTRNRDLKFVAGFPDRCKHCGSAYLPEEEADKSSKQLPPLLMHLTPKSIIIDEAHSLCNTTTKQSVAAGRIAKVVDNAILMSGTPITRDIRGFWRGLTIIDTRSFPNQDRYKERYADFVATDYQDIVNGISPHTKEEFYTLMQGTMRRVSKADVLTDLPPKAYSTRVVDIPPAWRAAYDEMAKDMIAHLPDSDEPLPVMSTLAQMQRLSQLASAACDVTITEELDDRPKSETFGQMIPKVHVEMKEPSWKVDVLMEILDDSQGSPIVTFSPHRQLMELAGKRAEREGYRVAYIVGGQTQKQRTASRQGFQDGQFDLMCVTTQAGGVGITLTKSHTAVFLERPWAYWQAAQSEDRLHRRGQSEPVNIIDVVARNTIESKVRMALKDKAQNLSELIQDPRIVRELLGGEPLHVN
jgi:SNF2 family DNA or RNA helicase